MTNSLKTYLTAVPLAQPKLGRGYAVVVAVLSLDPVNIDQCRRCLEQHDLLMDLHEPRDGEPRCPAIVIDTDSYFDTPAARRAGIEAWLAREVRPPVLAFFGLNIDDDLRQRLRQAGCLTTTRLKQRFLDRVARAARCIPPGPALT
jgi:hypothetical protein